jgi:hypothetical protein
MKKSLAFVITFIRNIVVNKGTRQDFAVFCFVATVTAAAGWAAIRVFQNSGLTIQSLVKGANGVTLVIVAFVLLVIAAAVAEVMLRPKQR